LTTCGLPLVVLNVNAALRDAAFGFASALTVRYDVVVKLVFPPDAALLVSQDAEDATDQLVFDMTEMAVEAPEAPSSPIGDRTIAGAPPT